MNKRNYTRKNLMLLKADRDYLDRMKKKLVGSCTKCYGKGRDCDCQKKFLLEVKKATSHIPIKYREFTIDRLSNSNGVRNSKKTVSEYIKNIGWNRSEGNGLFLWSTNKGTAKTALGCIVLMEALKANYTVDFTDLGECVALATQGFFNDDKFAEFEKRILDTDFLLIDDIGGLEIKTNKNGQLIESVFTTLFKKRCNSLLPTIMTSNLDPKSLATSYGERLYSISCEHLQKVECKGDDYRKHLEMIKFGK